MKATFNIGGAPTISYIGKKAFEDRMAWNEEGALVLVKSNAEDGMEITAVRALSDDGRLLVMVRALKDWWVFLLFEYMHPNRSLTFVCLPVLPPQRFAPWTETVRQELEGREGDARGADVREVVSGDSIVDESSRTTNEMK